MVNITSKLTTLSVLLCPSDLNSGLDRGATNYAGNTGYGYQVVKRYSGVFVESPATSSTAAITDGTSTTAMMSEWVKGSGRVTQVFDSLGSAYYTQALLSSTQFEQAVESCLALTAADPYDLYFNKGNYWLESGLGDSLYNHNIPPNKNSCLNGDSLIDGSWTASSLHGRGVHVLYVDGHVAFVSEGVSSAIWRGLGTRANGEVTPSESY